MQKYDVALSFAGEDRKYAKELADLLNKNGYLCFYDENELANLWGKNLYDHLSSIYKDKARYCVMFLSKHYDQQLWTNHERQMAQARAFQENREYILPVRLDDTEIPGIPPTIGYLDLRSITIEEVYEALDKKLSGATPKTAATDRTTFNVVEIDTTEYVLLISRDEKTYFIPFQNVQWDSTEISLELLPESPEETAFLRSLRRHISEAFARDIFIALALREDAAWVKPQEIVETTFGSQIIWKVVFNEERHRQNGDPLSEVTFGSFTPEKLAEERAKRILLNKKLPELPDDFQNRTGPAGLLNEATLEMYVRGTNGFQISASPIPPLYRIFGKKQTQFEKFARLTSILYLKLSNTVEEILQFDLKLLNSNQVEVKFKGRRRKRFTNKPPYIFEVNGTCQLSE
ncbi:MAG: TIR domain-containing protein [Candidatus Poribacteria bacterium]|nr:TIR domain-containing protein [Candidatus Poribacteria bacterium]